MFTLNRRSSSRAINIWPGFVDALSALLMVVIFVLMVFMVAQFYLSNLLSGQEEAVRRLNRQVAELSGMLDLERQENEDLRATFAQLSADLQNLIGERDALTLEVSDLRVETRTLSEQLTDALTRNEELAADAQSLDADLADAYQVVEASQETIELRLREIASLEADIDALQRVRDQLELEVAALTLARQTSDEDVEAMRTALAASAEEAEGLRADLTLSRDEVARLRQLLTERENQIAALEEDIADVSAQAEGTTVELRLSEEARQALLAELTALRDRSTALEATLSDAEERTALAQREIDERDIQIEELLVALDATKAALTEEYELSSQSRAQVAQLTAQIEALREELSRIQAALTESESQIAEGDIEIANLTARLNQALVRRVEELARYRSEFFGRLREVLGSREDVRVVGDRFVFQSEVLFPSGSARLQASGQTQLARFAQTLLDIAGEFPEEVDWILRVDGHTDDRPIATREFPSNWELSTARATEVVRFLVQQGVPPSRLAAAGFGEFQPLDPSDTPEALERNRRIELKLDQR